MRMRRTPPIFLWQSGLGGLHGYAKDFAFVPARYTLRYTDQGNSGLAG
jgi:hypothetical protein